MGHGHGSDTDGSEESESPEPRDKAEGWYLLHDMREVDWRGWNSLEDDEKEEAVDEAVDLLNELDDVDEGGTAVYSVLGDKADLMFVHVRPHLEELDAAERRFEGTRLADFTDETASHVSVAEINNYTNEQVESGELEGRTKKFVEKRLYPEIPDKRYVSFYPMSKKRGEEDNWYTLPKEERERLMGEHGKTGREYAGKVNQLISGSIGMDDWEWGVDLFTDDMLHAKHIVYEMRFDEASSRYSEFGPFYTGVKFPFDDLGAYMEGESVPTQEGDDAEDSIRGELEEMGIYAGKPRGEDVYAMVLYTDEDSEEVAEEVDGLRGNFEHYDTHVKTAVYDDVEGEGDAAVVSIWETEDAAETAGGYLSDLPGVVEADDEDGFGTMGMFYTVKPEYRDDFVEKFDEVGDLLEGMEGHKKTRLLANLDDENDMFIASLWRSRDDATEFFRSEEFRDTVDWGREVLADRPRHVFLA